MSSNIVNTIKSRAATILMEEAFTHIRNFQHEAYVEMAEENADLRSCAANFFTYGGDIYPKKTPNGTPIPNNVFCPTLHFSLINQLTKINNMPNDAGWNRMKNFFVAILDASTRGLVLNVVLPEVLVGALKKGLGEAAFRVLDQGSPSDWFSHENTEGKIANIKEHYADMFPAMRELLMDKLLLAE